MSEQTEMFAEAAERLFSEACPVEVTVAAEQGQFPLALWEALEAAGFLSMLLAEDAGGVEASLADVGAILRVAGSHAAPGPILETMLGRKLIADAGLEGPAGPISLGFVGLTAPGRAVARWGRGVERVLLIERRDGATTLTLAPPGDCALVQGSDASFEPLDQLTPPGEATVLAAAGVYDQAMQTAALLAGAQMLGALEWCVARTLAFANERVQFGRPIGGFQVIQHHLVALAEEVVAAAAIVAAAEAAAGDEQAMLVAAARSRLGDAADTARWLAHQTHGAIGFTREYPLNFRTRRLIAWRDTFGSTSYWRDRLASRFVGCKAEDLWARLV